MPGPRFDDREQPPASAPATGPVTDRTDLDDLALELPAWDLLPAAEFVRRRPVGD
jgi:hypothetical protein